MKPDQGSRIEGVSRETEARLAAFAALLTQWNRTVNLVAAGDIGRLWPRHIADSLQLLPYLPEAGPFADLGSGAGFPGLILAIASGKPFHLVEADQRKAAFLREAARVVAAPVVVHAVRAEAVVLPAIGVVTARAFAPLPRLVALAAPLLRPDGVCLLLKGAGYAEELAALRQDWAVQVRHWPSRTAPGGVVLALTDLSQPGALPERVRV